MGEKQEVEGLAGYREQINPVTKGRVTWKENLLFEASTQVGYDFEFDGNIQWGCAPMESLLLSLGGCLAIDVVSILKKMKVELSSFRIELTGEQNPKPPQYFKAINIIIRAAGRGLNESKIKRAVSLSQDKYCSVYHSLRKDLQVNIEYAIAGAE